jgi:hypothetical protein
VVNMKAIADQDAGSESVDERLQRRRRCPGRSRGRA